MELRFDEVRVHAQFIKQNNSPYSNGMGRETHDLVSLEIRMAGLSVRPTSTYVTKGRKDSHQSYKILYVTLSHKIPNRKQKRETRRLRYYNQHQLHFPKQR